MKCLNLKIINMITAIAIVSLVGWFVDYSKKEQMQYTQQF